MTKKMVNGEIIELTAEEETQRTADVAKAEEEKTAQLEAETKYATNKASAKQKLINGEPLTEEEADTIVL